MVEGIITILTIGGEIMDGSSSQSMNKVFIYDCFVLL